MGFHISGFTSLTGGTLLALDSIDGNALTDGCTAEVRTTTDIYHYILNATSGATENSPLRINPDANAGTKSWHLVGTTARIGALAYLTADESATSGIYTVPWDATTYDDASFWSSGAAKRFTVPVGVTGVKVSAELRWFDTSDSLERLNIITKNGTSFTGQPFSAEIGTGTDKPLFSTTPEIVVSASDYFEVSARQYSGVAKTISKDFTWFFIEATRFA